MTCVYRTLLDEEWDCDCAEKSLTCKCVNPKRQNTLLLFYDAAGFETKPGSEPDSVLVREKNCNETDCRDFTGQITVLETIISKNI